MKNIELVGTVNDFFSSFDITGDEQASGLYELCMKQALITFAQKENKELASEVYTAFMDCYKKHLGGGRNFIDLLDILRGYEENAALLIDKQRDHYVHSANVFLLGIQIYQQNPIFRAAVESFFNRDTVVFSNIHEEFFFRWGMASLFHDIGYPVEITARQISKFIGSVVEEKDAKPYIGYQEEQNLLCSGEINLTELLSNTIASALSTDQQELSQMLSGFISKMAKSGHVDHGFYSTLALLHRYSFLMQTNPKIYEHSILDAAVAILLHNYYKHEMRKPPLGLPKLKAEKQPLSYLLMLCDELQDWNREAYGILDRQRVLAATSDIDIDPDGLRIHYITFKGVLPENFSSKKLRALDELLELSEVFPKGITITATTRSELFAAALRGQNDLPRPFLSNIERLAKRIHERYNENQLKTTPEKELAYPTWDALPDDLKYSNIRQARGWFERLASIGMFASEEEIDAPHVTAFPAETVEMLAVAEHQSWMDERAASGWTYGPVKDVEKKQSPYMVPYEELSEEIRQLDRDAILNMFPLFEEIGLKIYRKVQ